MKTRGWVAWAELVAQYGHGDAEKIAELIARSGMDRTDEAVEAAAILLKLKDPFVEVLLGRFTVGFNKAVVKAIQDRTLTRVFRDGLLPTLRYRGDRG
jgi:hypothetical protein